MNPETDVDVAGLLDQVRQQADEVQRIQRSVEAMQIKGNSRNNEVTVTVTGTGRFTEINIDPETVRRFNARDLGEIVLEAVNDGLRKLGEASTARFKPIIEAAGRIERVGQ
ncbi:MAG TPA: YbaB/EbfC family nucleoid-associated protein [Pseudonocardiaceae bacterium]|nr:YbaB/EbfC family nucleoid-associated protein [Pseudonocardiaceae bacterium]